ncbi:unnamed protein product [Ilex paraguariensis]|uniref:Uncharacterized protein n=1 Tax=Ilex paraguariensis TaxID=185542 RepID=A0ABC8SRC4_9AQUA
MLDSVKSTGFGLAAEPPEVVNPNKQHGKQADISIFRAQLDALGLKIIQVTADDQLEGSDDEHKKYRSMVNKQHGKQADISIFRAQLDALGLKIIQVTADDQLEGSDDEHKKYRSMVMDKKCVLDECNRCLALISIAGAKAISDTKT